MLGKTVSPLLNFPEQKANKKIVLNFKMPDILLYLLFCKKSCIKLLKRCFISAGINPLSPQSWVCLNMTQ